LTTVSAGAALAVSPFRINLLQAQEATIKIGFAVPLTGPYGTEAQDQARAAQLAIAQFNDAGGRMSALGPKADVTLFHCDVRFVHPIYD
jgi:branched-chain amino acid transport system substrate-binding protein